MNVFIVHPETRELVTVAQWEKMPAEQIATAESVVIENEFGQLIELLKEESVDELKFDKALDWASERGGTTGTRKQWIDVYDAIYTAGLNGALKLIGGTPILHQWYWTCENDSDQSNANGAWLFNGTYGYLSCNYYRVYTYAARVFRAFRPPLQS